MQSRSLGVKGQSIHPELPFCFLAQFTSGQSPIVSEKPSNVIVSVHDGRPVPIVIDFGVAKAIDRELTERTIYTQFRQVLGTPMYMSPEQAGQSDLDVDTRSDVHRHDPCTTASGGPECAWRIGGSVSCCSTFQF